MSFQAQERNVSPLQAEPAGSWIDPDALAGIVDGSKAVLYVADYNAGLINMYPANGPKTKRIGRIKGIKGPNGIAVDKRGRLYVTENSNGDVLVFERGNVKHPFVLSDAGHSPESVAVADDGTVYVANHDFPQTGVNVQVYADYKAGTPSSSLSDASIAYPYYVAVDRKKNVYLTYSAQDGTNDVGEFPAGSTTLTTILTATPNFQGIGVDPHGNLVIDDFGNAVIDIYRPGSTSPTNTITTANAAQSFAFDAKAKDIYTADFSSNTVSDYAYPGGQAVKTIPDDDEHWGVAVSPAATVGTWHP